ncbi:hypothetical protein [Spirosoma validum]|uniref:Uncharacterized protein n=1 Tax=Spirosoma validum TaxID=2771355 RepID=A0A927GH91_9BACT|nr:hypothetical protein [Spirosoma validum]MBD2757691.1 hypothetical protein [Spirosoma validum]
MKYFLLLNCFLFIAGSVGFAQVGIGTTNPKATLQVTSANSGVLIPQYATLAQANANSLPTLNATDHKGLMIYIDEADNRGFWFYDGAAFVKVGTPTGVLPIANGGTGATTANAALKALLPDQSGNAGKLLTTNGTNASWQKPASRTRSIILDLGSIDVSAEQNGNPPVKAAIAERANPVIGFSEEGNQQLKTQIPIPADWNGTTPFQVTFYYQSATTSGVFYMLVGGRFRSLNDVISSTNGIPNYGGIFFPFQASSTPNGVMKKTITLSFLPYSANSEVLLLFIQRATGAADSANDYFNLLGIRIDYQD